MMHLQSRAHEHLESTTNAPPEVMSVISRFSESDLQLKDMIMSCLSVRMLYLWLLLHSIGSRELLGRRNNFRRWLSSPVIGFSKCQVLF